MHARAARVVEERGDEWTHAEALALSIATTRRRYRLERAAEAAVAEMTVAIEGAAYAAAEEGILRC